MTVNLSRKEAIKIANLLKGYWILLDATEGNQNDIESLLCAEMEDAKDYRDKLLDLIHEGANNNGR